MVVGSSAWIWSGVFFGFEEDCGGRATEGKVSEGREDDEVIWGRRTTRARTFSSPAQKFTCPASRWPGPSPSLSFPP